MLASPNKRVGFETFQRKGRIPSSTEVLHSAMFWKICASMKKLYPNCERKHTFMNLNYEILFETKIERSSELKCFAEERQESLIAN